MIRQIKRVIASGHGINYFGTDEELNATVSLILDLIAKELPKEKSFNNPTTSGQMDWMLGYNQCLKDIKHKLEVE